MKRIGHIALLSILSLAALAGAFILRAGIDVATARLADGKLAAAMIGACVLAGLLGRHEAPAEAKDEYGSALSWIRTALDVACLWLALAFMAGAIDAVPRSVPFLLAWILVSLGCLLDVARNRGWTGRDR